MALTLITAPSTTPITLAEVKAQRRIDSADEDTLLGTYIEAATLTAQAWTGRQFITATWELTLDSWRDSEAFRLGALWLPRPPIQAISSVKYIDTAGDEQTVDSGDYRLDAASIPGRLTEAINAVWPSHRRVTAAISIQYTSGFGDATTDVPDNYRVAMTQLVAHWDKLREPVVLGGSPAEIPMHVQSLLTQDMVAKV